MGNPAIFNGQFTKLLTKRGIMNSTGSINENDGPKNLVQNATFENQSLAGWSLGSMGTLVNGLPVTGTTTPTFNTGGAGFSVAISTTNPIDGTAQANISAPGIVAAGQMFASDPLTVTPSLQAKMLNFSHLYSVVSGAANLNFSGTSLGTFAMAAWDVTNSAWIPVNNPFNYTQSSLVGNATGSLQVPYNCTSLRLCLYFSSNPAGPFSINVKNFFLGITPISTGFSGSDWQDYVPTFAGLGTVTIGFARWKKVGDSIMIQSRFTTGTPTATTASMSLPNNFVSAVPVNSVVGFIGGQSSTPLAAIAVLSASGSSTLGFGVAGTGLGNNAGNGAFSAAGLYGFTTELIPIQGLTSGTQQSVDGGGSRVLTSAYLNSAQTLNATVVPVQLNAIDFDMTGSWNPTTYTFTAPSTDYYFIEAQLTAQNTATYLYGYVYVNGTAKLRGQTQTTSAADQSLKLGRALKLNANDTVQLMANASATIGLEVGSIWNYMCITKVPNPQTMQLTEQVNASITFGATSLPSGAVVAPSSPVVVNDTHGAFNVAGCYYQAPYPGRFRFTYSSGLTTTYTGGLFTIALTKNAQANGSNSFGRGFKTSSNAYESNIVTKSINLLAGDKVYLGETQPSGGTLTTTADVSAHYLDVEMVK